MITTLIASRFKKLSLSWREFVITSLFLIFVSTATRVTASPNPAHYLISSNSIDFHADATDEDMAVLDSHSEFRTVALGGAEAWSGGDPRLVPIKITDVGLAHLAICTNLETLDFSGMHPLQVTDDGLKSVEGLKYLRVVILGATPFHSAARTHFAGLTNIEELWLDFNHQFDDDVMNPVASLKNLRVLRFYGAQITDAGLAKIKGLSQLEDLQLGKCPVGDAGLQIISGFTKLKTLDLQRTRVTDAGLEHLKPLAKLRWLCLNGTEVSDKGISYLSSLTNMEWLILEGTQVDDAALDNLQKMSALQTLHLSNTHVTDVGIRKLIGFGKLDYLHLSGLPLTDEAVNSLVRLRSLKTLELNGTKITPAALDRLTAAGVQLINRGN